MASSMIASSSVCVSTSPPEPCVATLCGETPVTSLNQSVRALDICSLPVRNSYLTLFLTELVLLSVLTRITFE